VTDTIGNMDVSLVSPPLWMELTAIVAGALAGAVFGASRGLDAVGIGAMAVVGGLGGGVLRDILLGTRPLALGNPAYLYTVIAAGLVGMFFGSLVDRLRFLVAGVDAIALGLFTTVGVSRALLFDLPPVSAIMLGVVTGIGGGLLRDVLVGDSPPHAFRRDAPYASAALAGASLYAGLVIWTEIPDDLIALASMALVVLIRAIGVWRGWVTPGSVDLTPHRRSGDRADPNLPR
jgi:uncharacterized membrane protein YeiH